MKYIIVIMVLCVGFAYADEKGPPKDRPPDNRPPDKEHDHGPIDNSAISTASPVIDIESNPVARAEGGTGAGGDGGDSGGNSFDSDSSFFALSVTAPNIDGCIVGGSAGGGSDNGGALFQWGRLNHDCFMDKMAEAERHVDMRARLKCGGKHFRNAVAYNHPKNQRQAQCIKYATEVWKQEIDYLKELVANNGGDVGGEETPPDPK